MGLDQDFYYDGDTAFGPMSPIVGAVLPYEGRTFVRRAEGPWAEARDADADGWLTPDNPVLVRGDARILPLAWSGEPHTDGGPGPEAIAEFATQMEGAGYYWARSARTLDELRDHHGDSVASYVRTLLAAGATKATFWTVTADVGVALVWAGGEPEGTESLALHIVPASWVSTYRAAKPVGHIDVRWSWTDVTGLTSERPQAS